MRAVVLAAVVLLAGCASEPEPPSVATATAATPVATPTTTPTATPTPPPPAPTPPLRAGTVEAKMEASRATIRAGEEVAITLLLQNDRDASLWTNPEFVCSGSWDVRVLDATGAVVRVDDRDAMGCPSSDTYTTEVRPGESATALYTWDGRVRPTVGQAEPAPPGEYAFEGIARYANEGGASNGARSETATARVRIDVTG